MTTEWTYRQEKVRCGKRGCNGCPHGPYWYRYRRDGNRVKKEYCGKQDPRTQTETPPAPEPQPAAEWWEAILQPRGESMALACRIIGVDESCTLKDANRAFRRESMAHHPDRGGNVRRMQALNAAWAYLCRRRGW